MCQPPTGATVGLPFSGTVAEVLLLRKENVSLEHLLESELAVIYTRCVHDVLIVHDKTAIDPGLLTTSLNHKQKDTIFKPKFVNNEQINFLDLLIMPK
jgi:hypothetical protein